MKSLTTGFLRNMIPNATPLLKIRPDMDSFQPALRADVRCRDILAALQTGNAQGATKLQTTIKRATAQKAEIDADLNVTQAEFKASLQVKYETMLQAQLEGDTKTLTAARAKYKAEFEVAKAKYKAAKLKAQNKANAEDETVIEAAASLRESEIRSASGEDFF